MRKSRRMLVLLGLLAGVTVVWGVALAQNVLMERELGAIAQGLEEEHQERLTDLTKQKVQAVSVVTAAMDHVVYGQPLGKIAVYLVVTTEKGHRTYQGIEYHYLKEGETWRMTDSGACTAADALDAARAAFGHEKSIVKAKI